MKPKIFIGSSVEGLNVAYSIQQNLRFDAECTVWDQGVFELSMTTIESLIKVVDSSDFGIFVFSPDDIARIRKNTHTVVRDNVIFEFGLFVGKLTRQRVFFIIPEGSDLQLPTDFAGITPGKYDADREDGSLQAATGAVCHQIRNLIKKLGLLHLPSVQPDTGAEHVQADDSSIEKEKDWIHYFLQNDLNQAIAKLDSDISQETDQKKLLDLKKWRAFCHLRTDRRTGVRDFEALLSDHKESSEMHLQIASLFFLEEYDIKAKEILETAVQKFPEETDLKLKLAEVIKSLNGKEVAIDYLLSLNPEESISLSLALSQFYEEDKSFNLARAVIHKAYNNFPNNKDIRYRYAKICLEIGEPKSALYLFSGLTSEFPEKAEYVGYLSNCCVSLDLNDYALNAAQKANDLYEGKEQWIVANIGNLYKNRGFYTESIKYFEKSLAISKDHEFTHDRMSTSLKLRTEEREQYERCIIEGKSSIKNFNVTSSESLVGGDNEGTREQ